MKTLPFHFALAFCVLLSGCGTQSDLPDDVWVVEGDAIDFGDEEAVAVETGEIVVFFWQGLPIRNSERRTHLLWCNSWENPYGLNVGDRFRFSKAVDDRYFDEFRGGYYVDAEMIDIFDD